MYWNIHSTFKDLVGVRRIDTRILHAYIEVHPYNKHSPFEVVADNLFLEGLSVDRALFVISYVLYYLFEHRI